MIEDHSKKKSTATLVVLCILTLIGNVLLLLKGVLTYYVLDDSKENRVEWAVAMIDIFYAVELFTCLGCMLGAVLMLARKRSGMMIYQISAIVYIAITAALAFFSFFTIAGIPLGLLQFVYLVPSVIVFGLYQTQRNLFQ